MEHAKPVREHTTTYRVIRVLGVIRLAARIVRRATLALIIALLVAPAMLSVVEEIASVATPNASDAQAADWRLLGLANGSWVSFNEQTLLDSSPTPDAKLRKIVLLIHGLDEPGSIWDSLAPRLASAGLTPARFVYPNDQSPHFSAGSLSKALHWLADAGVTNISIVCHSMGGLVAWDALAAQKISTRIERSQGRSLHASTSQDSARPRIDQLVFVATPFRGSPLAHLRAFAEAREQAVRLLCPSLPFEPTGFIRDGAGEAGADLAPGSAFLQDLARRGRPAARRLTVIAASLLAADEDTSPRDVKAMLGDGVVPLFAAIPNWAGDIVVIHGSHRFILLSPPALFGSTENRVAPAAIPAILRALGVTG